MTNWVASNTLKDAVRVVMSLFFVPTAAITGGVVAFMAANGGPFPTAVKLLTFHLVVFTIVLAAGPMIANIGGDTEK